MDQAIAGGKALSKVGFDLLQNPFVLLRLLPTSTKEEVAEAFDEAVAEGWSDDEVLREARRQLLAPKLRLAATVDMLVDATPQQRDLAISALRDDMPLSDLISLAKDLPDASRSVFLSNVAQLRPSSGVLRYFALSLASVDRSNFEADIVSLFEQAGLPAPSAANVTEAFDASTARNVKRLFSAYRTPKSASVDIGRCMAEGLPNATDAQLSAYTALISAYHEYAAGAIGELHRKILTHTEQL